jgi:5-amino-6-(5-phospho-D-ribitylamino)uracil phosphatase
MTHSPYKLVVTDIDGTLVPYRTGGGNLAEIDTYIPNSAKEAIAKLQQAGVIVAGITGRTYDQSKDLLISLGINGPCVFAGGAAVRSLPSGEILYEASLDSITVENVCMRLRNVLGKDHLLELAPSASNSALYNSVWTYVPNDLLQKAYAALDELDDIYYVANPRIHANVSGLVVLRSGINKGSGVRHLMSLLGVERVNVACIGDGANDAPMFEECQLGIAMGNSEDILKRSADYIVSDIDNNGFAEAAEYILKHTAAPTLHA